MLFKTTLLLWSLQFMWINSTSAEWKSYEGYKLVEVRPEKRTHVTLLSTLAKNTLMDFWHLPRQAGETGEVLVSPDKLPSFVDLLELRDIPHSVLETDIPGLVQEEHSRMLQLFPEDSDAPLNYNYGDFNRYEAIESETDRLVDTCSLGLACNKYSIGQSVEGRDLHVISVKKTDGLERQAIWMDATIHAREWIATTTVMNTLNRLISEYLSNSQVTSLLDQYDFYIMPVVNPDGYVFSWTNDRYWRKNRRRNNANCFGVDLNRNWDFFWSQDGTSTNPCSDIYHGPGAGSEPEVIAIVEETRKLSSRLVAAVTVHSYGRLWLTPYGHIDYDIFACARPPNYDEILNVANAAADAIASTYGTTWRRGALCETLYDASGNAMDYLRGVTGIRYTFTPELRGTNFVISSSEIVPSFNEIWNGIVAMAKAITQMEAKDTA